MKMKYVIVSPRQHHGGPIVLHVLCNELCKLGYDASIYYMSGGNYRKNCHIEFWLKQIRFIMSDFCKIVLVKLLGEKRFLHDPRFRGYVDESVKDCKRKYIPYVGRDTIVVYPEIVYGNPLRAKNVVRYLLYYPSYQKGDYDNTDLFVAFREEFNDISLNPENIIIFCPYLNLELYKRTNFGSRVAGSKCYIVRKGANRTDLPKKFDGPVLDDLAEIEKVEAFNRYEYCISYDTQTGYSDIAALCGCISVVIPEEGKKPDDYRKEGTLYGIAYGFSEEEIAYAKETQHMVKKQYIKINQKCAEDVKKFADICRKRFK